jgi:Predicted amidohydrolase
VSEGSPLVIAAAQSLVSSDIAANGAAIRQLIAGAATSGARLVVFCEGALSGYAKNQIASPQSWRNYDWAGQDAELAEIGLLCGSLGIAAIVGGAHRFSDVYPPHNSLYVLDASGSLVGRYDKRFLSNTELQSWYTPGTEPLVFDLDGYRLGCAICIESQFVEVFREYETLGVDAVLFGSYGVPEHFQIALRAHAGLNNFWIAVATASQEADKGAAGIIGPDGRWCARVDEGLGTGLVLGPLDRLDPTYDIALNKARPWRARARQGDIYREKLPKDR